MRILCPTCKGKGTINDPQCNGKPMMYSGRNGETCPQVTCQTCDGEGWIGETSAIPSLSPQIRMQKERK